MRCKVDPMPKCGDIRTRRGFLIIPRIIENQLRWLEHAAWLQKCVPSDFEEFICIWEDIEWINK
jgi:hypothetical protein